MKVSIYAALATLCLAVTLTAVATPTFAQGTKPAPASPAPKQATADAASMNPAEVAALQKRVESYLRNVYAWGSDINVKVGELTPAPAGDLYQSTVVVSAAAGGGSDSAIVYLSKDGRYMLRGEFDDHKHRSLCRRPTTIASRRRRLQRAGRRKGRSGRIRGLRVPCLPPA